MTKRNLFSLTYKSGLDFDFKENIIIITFKGEEVYSGTIDNCYAFVKGWKTKEKTLGK